MNLLLKAGSKSSVTWHGTSAANAFLLPALINFVFENRRPNTPAINTANNADNGGYCNDLTHDVKRNATWVCADVQYVFPHGSNSHDIIQKQLESCAGT